MNFVQPVAEYNGVCLCEVTGEQYDPPDGEHRIWMVVRDSDRLDEELLRLGFSRCAEDCRPPVSSTAARWVALGTQREAKQLLDRLEEPSRLFLSRMELLARAQYATMAERRRTLEAYRNRAEQWDESSGRFVSQTSTRC